ncbi:MAG: sugar phosphorylase [Bacilli bacterium]|nr:sugar phosphorylase [Bacilli bacterium]MBN2696393.1 sugar phosphorylase [Bacilli bacterium]
MAIIDRLKILYPNEYRSVANNLKRLIADWQPKIRARYRDISEKDVCLITYGDAIYSDDEKPLATLTEFMKDHLSGLINVVHILPMYPYTSDDGFSVVDFRKIDPELGDWTNIKQLNEEFDLMFDAVINHVSVSSEYFRGFMNSSSKYKGFFLEVDPAVDLSTVVRPRTSSLITEYEGKSGKKYVWTTFSADQVDLNYHEPRVLLEVLDVLLFYVYHGARFIRFDAVGFIWKKLGTTCMHLNETHEIVKLMREVIDSISSGVKIITETNVKHHENISYFGNGSDEASLVYQFPLPPLVLHAYLRQDASRLLSWLEQLPETSETTTFFNFLASHDGIGLRPLEGLLADSEIKFTVDTVVSRGARINYRSLANGEKIPYECCITYVDALSERDATDSIRAARLLGAHLILLSLQGLPAVYYHSLLGSRNDYLGADVSGVNRRINREKLEYKKLVKELNLIDDLRDLVFSGMKKMIQTRTGNHLFHPSIKQRPLFKEKSIFCLERYDANDSVYACVNLSNQPVEIDLESRTRSLLTGEIMEERFILEPFGYGWYQKH